MKPWDLNSIPRTPVTDKFCSCTGAEVAAIVGAVAASSGTAYAIHQGVNAPEPPDPMELARQQLGSQREARLGAAKEAIPGARAESAARGLSGASPEFIAGQVGAGAASPEDLEEILQMVRNYIGSGGGGFNA